MPEIRSFDLSAALLTTVALIATFRMKLGALPVIGLCAAIGLSAAMAGWAT